MRALLLALGVVMAVSPVAHGAEPDGGASPSPAAPRDWDATARVLAGLPVDAGCPLAALTTTEAWQRHSGMMDAGWTQLEAHRLAKMDTWARAEVAPLITGALPVMYLFGGPDGISVDVLYPDAPRYLLFGLELPGEVPPLEALTEAELAQALENLGPTLKSTIQVSYFITDKMGAALKKSRLKGVLPLLLVFLSRHGDTVLEAGPVALDAQGQVVDAGAGKLPSSHVPGVRVRFLRRGVGEPRELLYFAVDLENDAVKAKPGTFRFLEAQGTVNSFLKAASFILHDRHFSKTRDYLLGHSASVLQDDSGLPFRAFKPKEWELRFFGEYTPNAKVFEDHFQADLKAAWDKATVRELPFRTGYPHVRGSNLALALKRAPAREPANDAGVDAPAGVRGR